MLLIAQHEILKALSDQTRLRIVNLLTTGELCVCDLISVLSLPQSTISRHIAKLRSLGLVEDRREGRWIFYSLGPTWDRNLSGLKMHIESLGTADPFQTDLAKLNTYLITKSCW